MANPQNLRPPWTQGQSGNPQGHSRDRRKLAQLDAGGDFDKWLVLFIEVQNRSIRKRLRALRIQSADNRGCHS
jgi:hypothetical protein